jgi:type VI secretion system protein ImpC
MAAEAEKQAQEGAVATTEPGEFASLLQKQFKPQSDRAKEEVESAVRTLAQQALEKSSVIGSDVVESINAMIAEIDKKLSQQINAIIHNADFQALESAWRGLHHLVNNTETDEMLKIRVMNISKKDLGKTLKKFKVPRREQTELAAILAPMKKDIVTR